MPKLSAVTCAVARTNCMWSGSLASKVMGVGGRFSPDQNSAPDDVTWSRGKLCSSCEMFV